MSSIIPFAIFGILFLILYLLTSDAVMETHSLLLIFCINKVVMGIHLCSTDLLLRDSLLCVDDQRLAMISQCLSAVSSEAIDCLFTESYHSYSLVTHGI